MNHPRTRADRRRDKERYDERQPKKVRRDDYEEAQFQKRRKAKLQEYIDDEDD